MFTNRKNKGKITFGNIMLTLLVLGLFVVIGLIGTLYVTLTKTPEQTAANYKREQESQAQIECWSPTNKSGRDCGASTPAAQANGLTPQQKSAASAVAYQIEAQNQAASEAGLALTRGEAPKKPKKLTPKNAERELIPQNSDDGTPLIAQEESPTRPVANEQTLRPAKKQRNADIDTTGERPLVPAPRPAKRDNPDATNALFD